MIAIPAIDLRGGACVQLVGGSLDDERVRIADPADAALRWRQAGFRRMHVVDLDAAFGGGENAALIDRLLAGNTTAMQVGGGLRTSERLAALLAAGADRVVVGTRAIDDPAWLEDVATRHPARVIVAADVCDRTVMTRGWTSAATVRLDDVIARLNDLPLAGILVTAIHVEGRMAGPDLALIADVTRRSTLPVTASGGIRTTDDLRALATLGAAAAIVGMALYTGVLDARAVAEEFDQ